ncbi:hypothetical protein WJX74_000653 [Apatococcus lobatus]|uniref:HMG box domain-containing protein n=2 Tax=Apatococcus TaxID=904362 RepID=A0AAW1TAK4_9CHLO
MAEAQNETPEVPDAPEVAADQPAEDVELDKGAQALELLDFVVSESASFHRRLAEGIKRFKRTGGLPVLRGAALQKANDEFEGQVDGTEDPEKPKAKRRRKGDKQKRKRAPSYFNMFVADQVEIINDNRKAQAEQDVKDGKEPDGINQTKATFREAVAVWSGLPEAEKDAYKQKKSKQMIAAGLVPPPTESSQKPKREGSAAAPVSEAKTAAAAPATEAAPATAPAAAPAAAPATANAKPTPAGSESPTAAEAVSHAPEANPDASPAPDAERKKKKKKKRKSEQVEPASSMQTDGQPLTEKKKKKKRKHHDNPEEGAGPSAP